MGAIRSKTSSSVGYATGKAIEQTLKNLVIKSFQKYEMRPIGFLSITKPTPENKLPPIMGNIFDSISTNVSEKQLENITKGNRK